MTKITKKDREAGNFEVQGDNTPDLEGPGFEPVNPETPSTEVTDGVSVAEIRPLSAQGGQFKDIGGGVLVPVSPDEDQANNG